MSDGKAASPSAAFQQHLMALNGEFERLVIENVQLRKLCSSSPVNFGSELHNMQTSPSNHMLSGVSGYPEGEALWMLHSLATCPTGINGFRERVADLAKRLVWMNHDESIKSIHSRSHTITTPYKQAFRKRQACRSSSIML